MRFYFYLLCVLFASSALLRGMNIWMGAPAPLLVSHTADIILFALCLRVAYGVAYNRRYFEPQQVRLIYWGTMILGIISMLLRGFSEELGLPLQSATMPDLVLWFLSYPLFAGPAALLDTLMKDGRNDCDV